MIIYYWPPSGGAGVQRCLKFVKYLRHFGWEPIVFTAKDAAYPVIDQSLKKDIPPDQQVIYGDIWEPYEVYKRFIGQKKGRVYSGFLSEQKKPSLTQRLSVWIRGNLFIPDARKFWIKPSIKTLTKYLTEHPVDAIFSSGPPHSTHMIARGVKRNTGIPWLADFRDPWTNIDFYQQLMLTTWADKQHKKMEQSVIQEADKLVTVSWNMADEFRDLGREQVDVITNAFDHEDFDIPPQEPDNSFTFSHIGYLNTDRNPELLWKAFGELCEEIPSFKEHLSLKFIGKTDIKAFQDLEKYDLMSVVEKVDYMPHDEVVGLIGRSQVLLLLLNNTPNVLGIIPGKTFEYLAARRPILAIGPEQGDAARIIHDTGAGKVINFEDGEKMKRHLLKLFQQYKKGNLSVAEADITPYTRKAATERLAHLLTDMTFKEGKVIGKKDNSR